MESFLDGKFPEVWAFKSDPCWSHVSEESRWSHGFRSFQLSLLRNMIQAVIMLKPGMIKKKGIMGVTEKVALKSEHFYWREIPGVQLGCWFRSWFLLLWDLPSLLLILAGIWLLSLLLKCWLQCAKHSSKENAAPPQKLHSQMNLFSLSGPPKYLLQMYKYLGVQ